MNETPARRNAARRFLLVVAFIVAIAVAAVAGVFVTKYLTGLAR